MGSDIPGANGAARRRRAARTLASATAHVQQGLQDLALLNQDFRVVATEILQQKHSFGSLVADLLALSINANAPLVRCLERGAPDASNDTTTTQARDADDDQTVSDTLELVFDIRSESAGPIFVALPSAGMKESSKTHLVGANGGIIHSERFVLRVVGEQLIVSLRDLEEERPDTYRGEAALVDAGGTTLVFSIVAICKPTLWWL